MKTAYLIAAGSSMFVSLGSAIIHDWTWAFYGLGWAALWWYLLERR